MMPREVERKKENVAKAERWNERGGLHSQRHNEEFILYRLVEH